MKHTVSRMIFGKVRGAGLLPIFDLIGASEKVPVANVARWDCDHATTIFEVNLHLGSGKRRCQPLDSK